MNMNNYKYLLHKIQTDGFWGKLHLREDFDVYLCMQVVRIQVFTVAAKHKSIENYIVIQTPV